MTQPPTKTHAAPPSLPAGESLSPDSVNTAGAQTKRLKTDSAWMFDTMQQAASYTGTPAGLLRDSKKSGCRAFKLGNRLDYLEFLHWFWQERYADGQAFALNKDQEATRKLKAEADKLERENKIAEGELIAAEDADALLGAKLTAIVQGLDSLAALVPGLNLDQRQILTAQIERIKDNAREAK